MRQRARILVLFQLVAIGAVCQYARAASLSVNCDKHESISKVLRLLATTNPQGPNTIAIFGSCKGNFVIRSMDRLTLIARKGASITDRSGGTLAVVDIEDSQRVTLQGFTIIGGAQGIQCSTASLCYLTGNTIQDSAVIGLFVDGASHAFLESNVIQNNGFRGSMVSDGSQMFSSNDVFKGNADKGVVASFGAYFVASNSSFLNNAVGIEAADSHVRLRGGTISGNGDGTILVGNSSATFQGPTITANSGVGVHLDDGSFAVFLGANITGNLSGLDKTASRNFRLLAWSKQQAVLQTALSLPANRS
jgi:hypothetical protein